MGIDLLTGQAGGDRRRSLVLRDTDGTDTTITTDGASPAEWVIPTGGGYFFAPSLSALRHLAATG